MKNLFTTLFLLLFSFTFAQTEKELQTISDLPIIQMGKDVSVHIISPEPVQYVDLSTINLMGDLPTSNIARIKINENPIDSLSITKKIEKIRFSYGETIGVITVVGQSFIAQYKAVFTDNPYNSTTTNIHIQPEHMQPIEVPKMELSKMEMQKMCMQIISGNATKKQKPIQTEKNLKLKMDLNNIYVVGNYIFLDVSIKNFTNLSYNIDGFKFSIEDKKVFKATNNQSVALSPIHQFHYYNNFKRDYRNIFVFKKVTFPNSKVLMVRMFEEQVSGRTIEMKINYSDVLNADTL